jgi:methyl-accepting chemotaxis protein
MHLPAINLSEQCCVERSQELGKMLEWYAQTARFSTKVKIAIGALVAVVVAMMGVIVAQKLEVDRYAQEYKAAARSQTAVADVKIAVSAMRIKARDYARAAAIGDAVAADRSLQDMKTEADRAKEAAQKAIASIQDKVAREDFGRAEKFIDAYGRAAIDAPTAGDAQRDAVAKDLSEVLEVTIQDLVAAEDAASQRMERVSSQSLVVSIITAALMLFLGIAVAAAMQQLIAAPIGRITQTVTDLASGKLSVEIAGVTRRDEVGDLARALEIFRNNALETQRLRADQETQRAAVEAERVRNEAIKAAAAEELRLTIDVIGRALVRLSNGDLSAEIRDNFPETYRALRENFNSAIAKLREPMADVLRNAALIRSGAQEITSAANDLSSRTEQQAASLEETAAALDQVTATIGTTATGAKSAARIVQTARMDAESSTETVQDTVDAMMAIERSAQRIEQIITVVDEIAFQTNLLALNAGVEAARAGEAGRGFAVVAQEVRGLAQRSAEAAREVKELISESASQVENGVVLVGKCGDVIQRIVGRVAEIDRLVTDIAASAEQQSTALSQVNAAINQMDLVTQQNAAMVEQSTAASHELARGADDLERSLSVFNLKAIDDTQVAPRSRQVQQPARSARRA